MSDESDKADTAALNRALDTLIERFETVTIFATKHETEDSSSYCVGRGNWFARYGQVRNWLIKREEETRCGVRKDAED